MPRSDIYRASLQLEDRLRNERAHRQEAQALARYERDRRKRAEAELARVAEVIARAGVDIARDGRDMHDWLAQVLQVLVLRMGNAEEERDQLKQKQQLAAARDPENTRLDGGEGYNGDSGSRRGMMARNGRLYPRRLERQREAPR